MRHAFAVLSPISGLFLLAIAVVQGAEQAPRVTF
jgi:hypothetical protein